MVRYGKRWFFVSSIFGGLLERGKGCGVTAYSHAGKQWVGGGTT